NIVFFFQAEDGIRDFHVTGVQTCALPILKFHRPETNQPLAKFLFASKEMSIPLLFASPTFACGKTATPIVFGVCVRVIKILYRCSLYTSTTRLAILKRPISSLRFNFREVSQVISRFSRRPSVTPGILFPNSDPKVYPAADTLGLISDK